MTGRAIILVLIFAIWFTFVVSRAIQSYFSLNKKIIDYFLIPVLLSIFVGLFANLLHGYFDSKDKLQRVIKKLKNVEGDYVVYHWTNFLQPEIYSIAIALDRKQGSCISCKPALNLLMNYMSILK